MRGYSKSQARNPKQIPMKNAKISTRTAAECPGRFFPFFLPLNLFRISNLAFRISYLLVAAHLSLLILPGCLPHFGTGGTGEMVVRREKLRRIDPLDLPAFAKSEP